MNILYITSFNQEIYRVSGKNLLNSIRENRISSSIFIGYENCEYKVNDLNTINYNLTEDQFLNDWLKTNADIIPEYLGGLTKPCKCADPWDRKDRHHKNGCHFNWWNRNTSRWFRKIACLNIVINTVSIMERGNFDAFVWIDADCMFLKSIPDEIWINLFANNDIFYMRGKNRRAIESGIIGFKNNKLGIAYIQNVINFYTSGYFRKFDRWDDGFIFKLAITDRIKAIDIAKGCLSTEVANYTILTPYIKHFKGRHGTQLNIMK